MGPSRVVSECPNLLLLRVQSGDTCLGVTGVLINDTDFWACPTPDESAPLDVSLGVCIFCRCPPRFRCLSGPSIHFCLHGSLECMPKRRLRLFANENLFLSTLSRMLYSAVLFSATSHSLHRLTFSAFHVLLHHF